jgi:hypothetical protein
VQAKTNIKDANKWDTKKPKQTFDYELDDDNFLQEFGFKKDADVDESISKFSSHAAFDANLPPKTDLMRVDSNAITEENMDYGSNNVSSVYGTDKIDDNDPENNMEGFLMNASNADIGFLKQRYDICLSRPLYFF